MIEQADIDNILAHATERDWMQMDLARYVVGHRRYEQHKGELKIIESGEGLYPEALSLNLKGLSNFDVIMRTNRLTKPLYAIDKVLANFDRMKVLCVGPRTEMEIFALIGMGFNPENIIGLDLFSYSPWVRVGNIMDAPFPDNSFDLVIAGWVIAYCTDPIKACHEISRVATPEGVIAIGSTYVPEDRREAESEGRGDLFYPTADELLERFPVKQIYLKHAIPKEKKGRTIVIFEQGKTPETSQNIIAWKDR